MKLKVATLPELDGKMWVYSTFWYKGKFIWPLRDLLNICRAIGFCEDIKYPAKHHKGRKMLAEFLAEGILNPNIPYQTLAKKYMIPERRQEAPHAIKRQA